MPSRINRAIELLLQDQAIYYDGAHSGHILTYDQGRADAATWADYINVGMEHGAFDMTGLADYLHGMIDAGPTRSGHRTPAVIVEAPLNGTDEANVRFNAWQFRQILGRGVHGILLCQAETADAVRAFVEACRYPHHAQAVDPALPSPEARLRGTPRPRANDGLLGIGTRGRGSETTAAPVWGLPAEAYMDRCDPYPPLMQAARDKVFAACRRNRIAFLEGCHTGNITARLDEGVRVISGHSPEMAAIGRRHQARAMPV